jgi:hypothetical protein
LAVEDKGITCNRTHSVYVPICRLWVHLRELTDELASLVIDTGTVASEDELQLKITEIQASVWHLENNIAKKTEELHLSDQKSHKELEWLKTNKWINLYQKTRK